MICPVCHFNDTRVQDSRTAADGLSIRRRRECVQCNFRFSTLEQIELLGMTVVKRSGKREPYCREKMEFGLKTALEKREYTTEGFKRLVASIETDLQKTRQTEIPSNLLGEIVLKQLRNFDKIAFIRFASVYKNFDSLQTFYQELRDLDE